MPNNESTVTVIDQTNVQVMSSPFSYVHINEFKLELERQSDDQDDISMSIEFDIMTGEWLYHESSDLVLIIDTQSIPTDLLLKNEKTLSPTSSFINLTKSHRFYSVNNEHIILTQPYANSSKSTTLTIKSLSPHKYSSTKITTPPVQKSEYIDEQIEVTYQKPHRELSKKYGIPSKSTSKVFRSSGNLTLNTSLSGNNTRKILTLKEFDVGLRLIGGSPSNVDFLISTDSLPSMVISKETKSKPVRIKIDRTKLWDTEVIDTQEVVGRLVIHENSDSLVFEHISEDIKEMRYLIPGYDYRITSEPVTLRYH